MLDPGQVATGGNEAANGAVKEALDKKKTKKKRQPISCPFRI